MWFPDTRGQFTLDARYGNLSYTTYRFNTDKFKNNFGISEYIPPNTTFRELAQQNNIPQNELVRYMDLRVRFAGWLTVLEDGRFLAALLRNVVVTSVGIMADSSSARRPDPILALFRRKWHVWVYNSVPRVVHHSGAHGHHPDVHHRGQGAEPAQLTPGADHPLAPGGGPVYTPLYGVHQQDAGRASDSVYVDGGNRMHYFFYVLLPLCKVVFGTFAVISITGIWNDLLGGLLYLDREHSTLIPMLNAYISAMTINLQAIYAGLAIAVLPLVIVYISFQRLFVKATFSGALKG